MANYPSISEEKVNDVIKAFDFERVHKRLVKEKLTYHITEENETPHIPTIAEMLDICEGLKTSMAKQGVSSAESCCFKMTKTSKKSDTLKLSFDFEKAKGFTKIYNYAN